MTKPQLTATNHTLPFEKLSPNDFERLCLFLVNAEGYLRAEHYGQGGNEQGRDVIAYLQDDGQEQRWHFQCKRKKELAAQPLKDEVDKIAKLPAAEQPHGIHFVTNVNVSAQSRLAVEQHCQTKGYACRFWAHTELDERVKNYPRIVDEFFGGKPATSQRASLTITLLLPVAIVIIGTLFYYAFRPKPEPVKPPAPPLVLKVLINYVQGGHAVGAVVELDALPGKQFITDSDGTVRIESIPCQEGDLIKVKAHKGNVTGEGNLVFPNRNEEIIKLR